jgi:phosphate-selective porin
MEGEVAALKKVKLSGYVQLQYQKADSAGIRSYAGGDFREGVDSRFQVRRGRLKADYKNGGLQSVIQIDVTERGVVIKDAYASYTPAFLKPVTLTAGMFNRPFGFELPYSSAHRESPERGRMSPILFPGERDLGAKITVKGPEQSAWHFITLEAGMFNGTGAPRVHADAADFDSFKDFIGRLALSNTFLNGKIKAAVGSSYYRGGWAQDSVFTYSWGAVNDSTEGFVKSPEKIKRLSQAQREYVGADAQFSLKTEAGLTTLRAEFIAGRQPGTSKSSDSPQSRPSDNTFFRKFNGAYFYFIQSITNTGLSVIIKYDWYDPNTQATGNIIGKPNSNTSAADLKFATLGGGLRYEMNDGLTFTAYYDWVRNETAADLNGFQTDVKDNVLTLRMQIRF